MNLGRGESVREPVARGLYPTLRFIRERPAANYGLSSSNLSYRASVAHDIRRRCQKGARG